MIQRCGYVAVLGAPNVGKSTLINGWVGCKVSIVSSKVQTTRSIVRGIALDGDSQIIFVDTPGIFKPKERLEKAMVAAAWQGMDEADILMLVVDASRSRIDEKTEIILKRMAEENRGRPCLLVLNKTDKAKREDLLVLTKELNDRVDFAASFMISATKEDGTKDVLSYLSKNLPECEWVFPEEQVSDMPMRLLAAELTREKCFQKLHQELPYAITVETEEWENFDDGSVRIGQVIFVRRDSHKAIVLGKGGQQIKEIGEKSRQELEEILDQRVHLKLFVKVQENWQDDPEKFQIWGLDYSA